MFYFSYILHKEQYKGGMKQHRFDKNDYLCR